MKKAKFDKVFLFTSLALVIFGVLIFSSASLGLLARNGPNLTSVAFNHIFLGLIMGGVACIILSRIDYKLIKKYAFPIFIAGLVLSALVFVPVIGMSHGGASRWLRLGPISFQPAEFMKIAFLIYFAAWCAGVKDKISTFKWGTLPFLTLCAVTGIIMLAQPDTDTFGVMVISGAAMLFVAGGKLRHLIAIAAIGVLIITVLAFQRDYIMRRIKTFIDPSSDPRGSAYQVQQSLIAIGSGQLTGRGFGQSVQKFSFLPEPMGDSIFAVQSEEFGFAGSVLLIVLISIFAVRGLKIASRITDPFGGLLVLGIVILIIIQSFMNIASMLGLFPLSGLPLIFVSQGGTALFFALAEVGIILNISRYQKKH